MKKYIRISINSSKLLSRTFPFFKRKGILVGIISKEEKLINLQNSLKPINEKPIPLKNYIFPEGVLENFIKLKKKEEKNEN